MHYHILSSIWVTFAEELRVKSFEGHLQVLNLSSNPLKQLGPDAHLPLSLLELHLSGMRNTKEVCSSDR
jgi:hypothetical protein